ncbi:MarR family winged helix-turn-helix transcriptional regulator [Bacillus rubiinfantis]|uniref:MarR family winged helix-turn-helix transcriptional regulator n=1 Tax=Bacillus rubiinfantis TaxID=1499680 RepID=UPI000AF73401|nr:MarR family winged helix-turn-helix transcriptional regulator [Bacillus rubiinfantis]
MIDILHHLDLIDLIGERHVQLRHLTEKGWNEQSDINISTSEWFILTRIFQKQPVTISGVAKQVDISRQASHKLIKQLKEKGLVEIQNMEHNKKEKSIKLTVLGLECYEKNQFLKAELESKIAEKIGLEQVKVLKEILKLDWGV